MPDGADGPVEVLAFERLGWVTNVPAVAGIASEGRSQRDCGASLAVDELYQVRPRCDGRGMSCLDALIAMIVRCLLHRAALVPVRVRSSLAAEQSVRPLGVVAPLPLWSMVLHALQGTAPPGPLGPRGQYGGGRTLNSGPVIRRL